MKARRSPRPSNFQISGQNMRTKTQTTITINAAAEALSIDRKTLKKRLADANEVPDPKNGRFTLRQVFRAVGGDVSGERFAKLKAEREIAQLQLAKTKGEMFPAKEVEAVWSRNILAVRARFLQLPDRLAVRFPMWPDSRTCRAEIEAAVFDCLTEIATSPEYLAEVLGDKTQRVEAP